MPDKDVLAELGVLIGRVEDTRGDIAEIKESQQNAETRGITFEKTYIAEHTRLTGQVEYAHARISNHDIKIAEIKIELYELTKNTREEIRLLADAIKPLAYTSKVITWIFAALGTSIIALVIAIITGQVELVFK